MQVIYAACFDKSLAEVDMGRKYNNANSVVL